MTEHVYVRLKPVDGYPPFEEEELDAALVQGDDYSIDSVPFWARDLSRGDRVRTRLNLDRRYVERVLSDGGHSTIRVVMFSKHPLAVSERIGHLSRAVAEVGAEVAESQVSGLFAIDLPPAASLIDLDRTLNRGLRAGWWDVEEATLSPEHRASRPIAAKDVLSIRECHCRIDEPIPGQEATFDDSDRTVMANIAEHGWHIVQIPDEPQSTGWVFSVGMWHTLGSSDLAVFGLALNDAASLINQIGDRVRSGRLVGPDVIVDDLLDGNRLVTFRPVHASWDRPLFGYAHWFGRRLPLPMAQVVWADVHGRFLWDEGIDDWYRNTQPSIWIPAADHPHGRWSGTLIEGPWPFPDPPDTLAFSTKRIVFDRHPVLHVVHNSDGAWQFLDGQDVAQEDVALVHMAHVVGAHEGVVDVADLPRGWEASRESALAPWTRHLMPEKEDGGRMVQPLSVIKDGVARTFRRIAALGRWKG